MANTTLAEAKSFVANYTRMAKETRAHIVKLGLTPGTKDHDYFENDAKQNDTAAQGWKEFVAGYHGGRK